MKSAKEEVLEVMETIPDDASLEDIERRIHALHGAYRQADTPEHMRLAQTGKSLAARVWPREDFTNWERP
jgi:hypothetical protein